MFSTQRSKVDSDYELKGDPVSIVATNIPSYMGGRANPWRTSKGSDMGVVDKIESEGFENPGSMITAEY